MLLNLLVDTQALDVWHDTVFQLIIVVIVTLLSAFIGGAIVIWVYRKQKSKKEITYQIVSDAPIASINQAVADRVELRFDGNPIKEARILVLKVWNSGNVAVKRDDYDEPITFTFHGRTVISSDILETTPTDLIDQKIIKTFLTFKGESVEIPKFLLNPQQSVSVTTLLIGAKNSISIRARIIDGKVEHYSNRLSKFYRGRLVVSGVVIVSGAVAIAVALTVGASVGEVTESGGILTIFGPTIIVVGIAVLITFVGLIIGLLAIIVLVENSRKDK